MIYVQFLFAESNNLLLEQNTPQSLIQEIYM